MEIEITCDVCAFCVPPVVDGWFPAAGSQSVSQANGKQKESKQIYALANLCSLRMILHKWMGRHLGTWFSLFHTKCQFINQRFRHRQNTCQRKSRDEISLFVFRVVCAPKNICRRIIVTQICCYFFYHCFSTLPRVGIDTIFRRLRDRSFTLIIFASHFAGRTTHGGRLS
jgi:hypothetical protein